MSFATNSDVPANYSKVNQMQVNADLILLSHTSLTQLVKANIRLLSNHLDRVFELSLDLLPMLDACYCSSCVPLSIRVLYKHLQTREKKIEMYFNR